MAGAGRGPHIRLGRADTFPPIRLCATAGLNSTRDPWGRGQWDRRQPWAMDRTLACTFLDILMYIPIPADQAALST